MLKSTDRIKATHAGSLPRPEDLREMVVARGTGKPYDAEALSKRLKSAVKEVVQKQIALGMDSINDGELSKISFTTYCNERLGGIAPREVPAGTGPTARSINGRDKQNFPNYFNAGGGRFNHSIQQTVYFATEPLKYIGQAAVKEDIENFKAALEGVSGVEAFLPANSPGTIEHWLHNEHYPDREALLFAIADAMREEYKAITDAGFLLQIDDPDLPDAWQMYPEMSVAEYRKYAEMRVDALNHALRGIPKEQIRLHVCWGSPPGPHVADLPLEHLIDLIFKVPAASYSIEASNPRHEHEWKVFEKVKVPEGSLLIPGVVGHHTTHIEHPEVVAGRLVRYANLVGKENVGASADCGLGMRTPTEIAWAKIGAIAEGAQLASKQLWGRA